jgi:hypothetical protein
MSFADEGRELVRQLVAAETRLTDEIACGYNVEDQRHAEREVEKARKAMAAWFKKLEGKRK